MSLLAKVFEEHHGVVTVAAVDGEVDASNAEEVADRLRSAVTNRSVTLVVDLTRTTYLDSAGINLLFKLAADLRERQQSLCLVVPPSAPIGRTITITGLDSAAPTYASREAALVATNRAAH